ncbi:MAG: flagella basal body P-ring formation protein FlgA [Comamonadaceae bacterium]|nr:flagella basal body P-ring formation protein FlgA [Comamonadaceae bacterium]
MQGAGFQVTSSGKALQGGSVGESVRVRMDNGRTVIGTVNAQGEVLVAQ